MRLEDKVAIITGATGGIGSAIARRYVEEGAKVMLSDLDQEKLNHFRVQLGAERVATVAADTTNQSDVMRMAREAIECFGRIDILAANAGIECETGSIAESDVANFERVMEVNVTGTWLCLKAVIPEMNHNRGGSIIITSSAAGLRGSLNSAAYNTSKHALIGLMKCAALEGATDNVRVNTINPGPIETRMLQSIERSLGGGAPEEVRARILQSTPLGRCGTTDEVANLALFLASDESSYCTGGVYTVDGGFTAK